MKLIDADELRYNIINKGQSSKRYKLGENWELNYEEICEVINGTPAAAKTLNLAIEEHGDKWEVYAQEINLDEFGIYFKVYNINKCPEDAIIGRDLFTAEDYIKALKKGIELAQMGYTDIKYTTVKIEEKW